MEMAHDRPTIRKLDIQPDGTIPDWPESFFGEAISLTARLLRAQDHPKSKPPITSP